MIFFLFDEKTEPADIFAEIPSEKSSATVPSSSPAGTTPLPIGESGVILHPHAPLPKKGLLILVVGLVMVGAGLAAFLYWRLGTMPTSKGPAEGPQPSITPPAEQPIPEPEPQPQPQPQPQLETDTDGDGLTDAREATLGTSAVTIDTDADGLSDREEVDVYLTNPVNPDSDGDTYKDGEEVKNGYDPKGPGKLLQLPPNP